ncbi:SMP-30/gluconolactonase/LRE family protein [Larkinella terrae]|uniref:SMP-30/gluconolactonase/LRE family protein n=1 Tax=Larkinella terrae TaxID=2025311 RepID=A0A7K0ERC3_9BACT|nr:SMP-30/gluconolactonase/LRE family protein [Larkinella terrae]MRS64076.1 SMP-30/gluconolactonase/LRE family protein [Larkinella terrae]
MHHIVEKLLDLSFYTEGPVVDREENFYFSTLTGGEIVRVDTDGAYSVWAKTACPNGQVILPDGTHWVCDPKQAAVSRFDATGEYQGAVIQCVCAGAIVQSPNDLIIDSQRNLYFTDSIRTDGKVFFVGSDGLERIVADSIDYANGLVLSSDERFLYVAESFKNRVLVIELAEPGIPKTKPNVFADLPVHRSGNPIGNLPDGLAIDRAGNVWVAHYGMQAIQVLSAGGDWRFSIDTSLPLTSNLCFLEDNPERQTLLVTGGYGEPGPGGVVQVTVFP